MLFMMRFLLLLLPALWAGQVLSGEWPLRISPETITIEADEGDEVMVEIAFMNSEDWPTPVRLEAVNWGYDKTGQRRYGAGSEIIDDCRDWWPDGSADLLIQPTAAVIYQLKIHVPDDMEEMECHFALAVLPVRDEKSFTPRYLPVYVAVEDPEAELEFDSLVMQKDAAGKPQPMVMIRNVGTARSKLYGVLEGEDAQGQELDLVVRSTEILAGETRAVPLIVSRPGGGEVWWSAPLEIEGNLIWNDGEIDIDEELN